MDLRKIKMSLGDARAPTTFLLGCWSRWSGMGWKNQIKNGEVALTPCRREKEELEANSAGRCMGTAPEVMESSH